MNNDTAMSDTKLVRCSASPTGEHAPLLRPSDDKPEFTHWMGQLSWTAENKIEAGWCKHCRCLYYEEQSP